MRETIKLTNWEFRFAQDTDAIWQGISVPHTWNAFDGQAGGGYRRTRGIYRTSFLRPSQEKVFIRFEGANMHTTVYLNGQLIGEHVGGYSAFQFEMTQHLLPEQNLLIVEVSNEHEPDVYPAFADYTFFGGVYRDVSLICLGGPHFSLSHYGSLGVFITPNLDGSVHVRAFTDGGHVLCAQVFAPEGKRVACEETAVHGECTEMTLYVGNPVLWQGIAAPNLYRLDISLDTSDALSMRFGFRSVNAHADDGFILNGAQYRLHGVSRHQDRENKGWAIGEKEHREDLDIICEIGANTVRLPHYQQAEYVLDLCDERGLVVWAETPMNAEYLPGKRADYLIEQQLLEMLYQQYNHPCVCFWSIANEISIGGTSDALMSELHRLNSIVHEKDDTRLTVMTNLGSISPQNPLWAITDVASANMYLGWYDGKREDFAAFLDRLHASLNVRPLALSEYGAEAVMHWHSDKPKIMDYTEEYQALVHESAWMAIAERQWLVGSWVWNLFDFAANHRDEGGVKGRNNKGLVTYDRKVRKDAFWFYKACWSKEPFVYITGKRFTRRSGTSVDIKVYSNEPRVELSNGNAVWVMEGHTIFVFKNVPLTAETTVLTAKAGECRDTLTLKRLEAPDTSYIMPLPTTDIDARVQQWFAELREPEDEIIHREGYYTMKHTMDEIIASPEAMEAVELYWARPMEITNPSQAARLRKGGHMPPASIWRYIQKLLPHEAYGLLDMALSKVKIETNNSTDVQSNEDCCQ